MKAKDYAQRYKTNPTDETLIDIVQEMIMETKTLAEQRKITTESAMIAIIRQQDEKWKAFCRLCSGVNPKFFKLALHHLIPVSAQLYP